jgi:hypothetical protein
MKYPRDTSQCNNSQLRALLSFGKTTGTEADKELAEDPREVLADASIDGVPAGELWRRVVADGTDIGMLSKIKTSAKLLHQRVTDTKQRDAATTLYHLALAAALARNGVSISNSPISDQVETFGRLAGKTGDPAADAIFYKAIARWNNPTE